jgi:hypothetical protein
VLHGTVPAVILCYIPSFASEEKPEFMLWFYGYQMKKRSELSSTKYNALLEYTIIFRSSCFQGISLVPMKYLQGVVEDIWLDN